MTVKQALGITLAVLVGASGASPVAAQARGWVVPKCDIKPGHYLVNSGVLYLKNASETRFEDQKQKDLRDALRVLTQALTSGGQDENPAAWYYLGRYYQMVTDLSGADSAFTRALALAPTCKDDIGSWRRVLWTPVFNKGVQAFNAGQTDTAIVAFRLANVIYSGEPGGHNALANLYANQGQVDSAARYYGLAAQAAAADPVKYAKERREALFNRGAVLHQAHRWNDALAVFQEYLAAYPGDAQAMAGVASAHAATGNTDSATAMYVKILDRADSVTPEQLFHAGVAVFNGAPPQPDTATAGTSCRGVARRDRTLTPRRLAARCDSVVRAMIHEHDAAAAGTYRMAARAFEAGLGRNPGYRDALFNLTNTYLVLQDTANMLPAAQRLVAVDPMGRGSLRLLAAAWQLRGKPDSTLKYLAAGDSLLPVEVSITRFGPEEQNASLNGLVTNFHDKPSEPLQLTIEFLDAKGEVVASQTVDIAAIEPGGSQGFQTSAIGAGIVSWRYKKG
ncbi:MAG: tetratricopeptide repeat protein [Gemmatimonadetes bacterium]|nr:tetratricopeptide repeat protein [Gemmatimonadota bacterium]